MSTGRQLSYGNGETTVIRFRLWERIAMTMRLAAMVFALAGALTVGSLDAAEFKFDAKTNADIAKKLRIPVYFTVPDTARLELPTSINTSDKLVDFHHPDA